MVRSGEIRLEIHSLNSALHYCSDIPFRYLQVADDSVICREDNGELSILWLPFAENRLIPNFGKSEQWLELVSGGMQTPPKVCSNKGTNVAGNRLPVPETAKVAT